MLTEKEYRELPSEEYFSSSFLKEFDDRGPLCLINPKKYDNSGIRFGSIADILLSSSDEFKNDYHVTKFKSSFPKTAQQLFDILSNIIKDGQLTQEDIDNESDIYIKTCLDIINTEKLWSTTKDTEKLKKHFLDEEFKGSLIDLIISKHKKLVSTEDFMKASLMAKVLREHEFTKDFIVSDDLSKKQILFQTPILFEHRGHKYKSLIDVIVIDHETKSARIVDYKTGALPNDQFKLSFFKFRYDIQAALYTKALREFLNTKGLKDYEILSPVYLYTSVLTPETPLPVMIPLSVIKNAFNGFTTRNGRIHKGIDQLTDEILWHRKHKLYDYSRTVYESKFEVLDHSFAISSISSTSRISDIISNYHGMHYSENNNDNEGNNIEEDESIHFAPYGSEGARIDSAQEHDRRIQAHYRRRANISSFGISESAGLSDTGLRPDDTFFSSVLTDHYRRFLGSVQSNVSPISDADPNILDDINL